MGILDVVVLALLAVFHGLNDSLGVAVEGGVAVKLAVAVVLAATAITVNTSSVSLLMC